MVKGPAGGAAVKHSWGAVPLPDTLQWAAFYSDLEHEILPVNTGYRCVCASLQYHVSEGPYLPGHSAGP